VVLELLKRLKRGKLRIGIVQTDDEADINPIPIELINKTAAIGAAIQWPANAMQDMTRFSHSLG